MKTIKRIVNSVVNKKRVRNDTAYNVEDKYKKYTVNVNSAYIPPTILLNEISYYYRNIHTDLSSGYIREAGATILYILDRIVDCYVLRSKFNPPVEPDLKRYDIICLLYANNCIPDTTRVLMDNCRHVGNCASHNVKSLTEEDVLFGIENLNKLISAFWDDFHIQADQRFDLF